MKGLLLLTLVFGVEGYTQCLDNYGYPVDWFMIYKRNNGHTFYYMDSGLNTEWIYVDDVTKTLDLEDQAVGHTLNQIYHKKADMDIDNSTFLFGMYSDQVKTGETIPSTFGHTKGVVAFDEVSGFWLVHSIPCFPTPASYECCQYCKAEKKPTFGQTMLCISVDTENYMDVIGYQLRHNDANVYLKYVAAHFEDNRFANMTNVLSKEHLIQSGPCANVAPLQTLEGKVFQSYAKCTGYGKDLYMDWLLEELEDDLYVETWRRHKKKLRSKQNGLHWVINIDTVKIEIPNSTIPVLELEYTQDHSKWAVTGGKSKWVCIGDINREKSQYKRGGGTVCVQDDNVWYVFRSMVYKFDHPGMTQTTTAMQLTSQAVLVQTTEKQTAIVPAKRKKS